ncbi:MAG: prepilin-type N-terminal cleavage/methylation domain-containing protein [Verrucomicrobiota bacterium]
MKPNKPRGFTLVELMVTIVIVSVLATLVFLFSKRGLQAAKAAECASNMRQVYTGVQALVESGVRTSHNPTGSYPPYAGQQQGPWNQFVWIDLVAEQMGIAELEGSEFIWNVHPKETVFQNPLSEHTLGGNSADWDVLYGNSELTKGSYTYNNQIGEWVAAHTPNPRVTRASAVPFPSNTILFGESNDNLQTGSSIACWSASTAPQGNYKDSAHCLFVDGHVELIPNNNLNTSDWYNHYMGVYTQPRPGRYQKSLGKPE